MPSEDASLQRLAATWAGCIARAERPSPFSSRDGSVLRLVPVNERLPQEQLQQGLVQLLTQQQQLVTDFNDLISHTRSRKVARQVAAWARGWCYLATGNHKQALRDANTALAYAADAKAQPASTQHHDLPLPVASLEGTCLVPSAVAEPTKSISIGSTTTTPASQHSDSTALGALSEQPAIPEQTISQPNYPVTSCKWRPALQLAAECHAALGNISSAVVLLTQADQQAPNNATVTQRLSLLSRQLPPEQGLAWKTGGLSGLLQELQDEAEMKLPEVLRPRPKWYYYNKWMTNRIHTALLDLHLGGSLIGGGQLEAPSSEQLLTAAEAAADTPAIAEAAAAAGFFAVAPHAAIAAGAGDTLVPFQQHPEQMPILQLAKPVLDKLLTLDAGDLDLMIKHPIALQAQVYELLDLYQSDGAAALQDHTIPELSWGEVQALAATAAESDHISEPLVGLPLGYTPPRKRSALPAGVAAILPALEQCGNSKDLSTVMIEAGGPADGYADRGRTNELACGPDAGSDQLAVVCTDGAGQMVKSDGLLGWRQKGWRRAEYLLGHGR